MIQYSIADKLYKNQVANCAALVVTQDVSADAGWPKLVRPDFALRNGTLTFVKTGDRTFGITCQHVVQHYRDVLAASGKNSSHSMRTMLNGFYIVQDRFVQPQVQFGDSAPDIAIREVRPAFISTLGKEPIDLDSLKEPPEDINYAFAVGFPEKLKYNKTEDNFSYRVAMPHVAILAELPGRPTRRFTMFSELIKPALDIEYSGMSGGPIYWSKDEEHGILGIIYEGGPGNGNNSIFVYGEFATAQVIKDWIAQCCPNPLF